MSLNKLESWLTETPKHLVAALFSLAAAGIVLVIVILFVVSPQIAAIPNDPDAKAGPPTEIHQNRFFPTFGGGERENLPE